MTAPYRIRGVLTDRLAALAFGSLLVSALLLGLTPAVASAEWSVLLFAGYVSVSSTMLLATMYVTDRRLREVSST